MPPPRPRTGCPIVVPDSDGDGRPDRARRGAAERRLHAGTVRAGGRPDGGPGSIWKIDGRTGAVSCSPTCMLAGVPNSGPGAGRPRVRSGVAPDFRGRSRHRHDPPLRSRRRRPADSSITARTGLSAAGLPPARIRSAQAAQSGKSGHSTAPRRRRGLRAAGAAHVRARGAGDGVSITRSRPGCGVWSVAILPGRGRSVPMRAIEAEIPPGSAPGTEISDVHSTMKAACCSPSAARRPAPTTSRRGSAGLGPAVLRMRAKAAGAGRHAVPLGGDGEYAVGFPPEFQNANGGSPSATATVPAARSSARDVRRHLWSDRRATANARPIPPRAAAGRGRRHFRSTACRGTRSTLSAPAKRAAVQSYYIDQTDPLGIEADISATSRSGGCARGPRCRYRSRWRSHVRRAVQSSRAHLPIPARVSGRDRVCGRLLRLSRLPGELCAHPRPMRAAAAQLR